MSERRAWILAGVALALLVAAAVWIRWPGFTEGGFASHDVAGILYNAMLLRAGGLPYVDSIELKAPGTFYLAALLAGPEGRDIARFQIWANAWAIASMLGVAGIGGALWGARAAVAAAAVYLLGDAFLDSMDANYVTWAQLPQILAVLAAVFAARGGRRRLLLWALAGAIAGAAALCKRPDGAVLIVLLAWSALGERGREGRGGVDLRALAAVVAGFLGAHVPIAAHYLARGELGGLVDGYVLNTWGARYIVRKVGEAGALAGLGEGARATAYFLALPLLLALYAGLPKAERRLASPLPWLWLWVAMTLVAAAVGLRFYKGYFVAVAPALALIAAAPGGLLAGLGARRGRTWRVGLRAIGLGVAIVLAGRAAVLTKAVRDDRQRPHDRGGRLLAAHITKGTAPGDRIWVWGWHLWDVYAFTGHLSGSRIYKSLGLLTPANDDTWRRPASRLVIAEDSPFREMLIEELRASQPKYIALGSTVPRDDFVELRALLRERYVRDRGIRVGRVEMWRLRDRL